MADKDKKHGRRDLQKISGDTGDLLHKTMSTFCSEYVTVGPGKAVMPIHYEDWYEKFDNFQIKKDDVWVVTYPKAGTTWTQELVWSIMFDMDSEEAKQEIMRRFPFFEIDCLISGMNEIPDLPEDSLMKLGTTWKILQNMKSPRVIKSHFPLDLLPDGLWAVKPKIVYVMRDPRDVCVSYYYHSLKFEEFKGTFDEFVRLFLEDMLTYSPTWSHMLEFWQKRNEENILLIRYEEMKEDLSAMVRRVSKFLEKSLTEEEVVRITDHCTFDTMKNNKAANQETMSLPSEDGGEQIKFMRKGIVGDWKNHLSPEQQKAFKEWTMKNVKGTDFPFYQDYD